MSDLKQQITKVTLEEEFLQSGLKRAKETYNAKQNQHNVGEYNLFVLAWVVDCFEKLLKIQKDILSSITAIQGMLSNPGMFQGN